MSIEYARKLRRKATPTEKILWQELRNRKLEGKKFLRQHRLYFQYNGKKRFFIADFYCHDFRLVVEIDGGVHAFQDQKEYDEARTVIINQMGIQVIRFKNEEIEDDLERVVIKLRKQMGVLAPFFSNREGARG